MVLINCLSQWSWQTERGLVQKRKISAPIDPGNYRPGLRPFDVGLPVVNWEENFLLSLPLEFH